MAALLQGGSAALTCDVQQEQWHEAPELGLLGSKHTRQLIACALQTQACCRTAAPIAPSQLLLFWAGTLECSQLMAWLPHYLPELTQWPHADLLHLDSVLPRWSKLQEHTSHVAHTSVRSA